MFDKIKRAFVVSGNEPTNSEKIAIANLVSIAKERIWIADPLSCGEYKTENFETEVDNQTIEQIKKSVCVVQNFLDKHENEDI